MKCGRTEVTPGFFLTVAVLLFLDTENLLLYGLLAALIHEAAHIVAVKACGGGIAGIRLSAAGAEIVLANTFCTPYLHEALIYMAGPAANILTAFTASWAGGIMTSTELYAFAGLNLTLGLFNLLPAKMLDGGNALRSVCLHFSGRVPAALTVAGIVTVLLLLAANLYVILIYGVNISLLLAAAYLLLSALTERRPVFRGLSNDRI